MFKQGDLVLHRHYGVGTVTDVQNMKITKNEQVYYVIDLAVGERLLIPIEQAEQLGLSTLISSEAIINVLLDVPQILADDFRLRQTEIDQKIGSGDPLRIAEALRDLNWRGQATKLSTGDIRLMFKAHKFLSSLLAAQFSADDRSASQRLDATLKQAVTTQQAAQLAG
jgi:RNA polymerase-interacting CarD/CdnL/TRCF family regulator